MFKAKSAAVEPIAPPLHVAVIMDGNGRWAKSKGLPRMAGHKAGGDALRRLVRKAGELGIGYFSVYAFSTENWSRPEEEVSGLMKLLIEFCKGEIAELKANNTRLKFLGDLSQMPKSQLQAMLAAEEALASCTGLQLNICINYGGRREILDGIKKASTSGVDFSHLTEETFSQLLYTKDIPDPDLLIRTSGEQRLSNFFLWQLAYTEFLFIDKHWPEMQGEDLEDCLRQFAQRNRRFGKL